MGKKGSWFSAIKRVFSHKSKDKPTDGSGRKNNKLKKKGKEISKHRETKSFIPLFREPSSIEKILGEADQLLIRPPSTVSEKPKAPPALIEWPSSPKFSTRIAFSPTVASPRISSPKPHSPKAASPEAVSSKVFTPGAASSKTASVKVNQRQKEISYVKRLEPSIKHQHLSATKIQAAYRGYQARRSFRSLRGIVRLQGVVRGQNVKRQTMNAIKQMQLLVKVQTQIQSRRIQMLENQAMNPQPYRNDKDTESTMSKWTQLSDFGNNEDWNDSSLTKEEVDARLRKKVEAAIKRERAMSYAYSHQLRKLTQTPTDLRSNGYPWWWNWLERQFPPTTTKNITLTPSRPISEYKPSSQLHSSHYNHTKFSINNPNEALTPHSSRSSVPIKAKQFRTPNRFPPQRRPSAANSTYNDVSLKDDDSLMSCPPFSVPNYMTPTVSAKAKVRANSNPRERFVGTPSNRRFSFPLTPNIDSFKWSKGSNKDSTSQMGLDKRNLARSIEDLSVDSVVSMPVLVGRKPFNRFV